MYMFKHTEGTEIWRKSEAGTWLNRRIRRYVLGQNCKQIDG